MIKKVLLLSFFPLLISPLYLYAQERYDNGHFWIIAPRAWKIGYIEGFSNGMDVLSKHEILFQKAMKSAIKSYKEKHQKLTEEERSLLEEMEWYLREQTYTLNDYFAPAGVVLGDIIEGVDKLYKTPINREILIPHAIYIVVLEARGEPEELIRARTSFYRSKEGRAVGGDLRQFELEFELEVENKAKEIKENKKEKK